MSEPTYTDRLCELLEIACALDEPERSRYLDRACENVRLRDDVVRLVAAQEEGRARFPTLDGLAPVAGEAARQPPVAPALDRYDIVRPIGMGGHGAVFLARQHDTDREVAIKALGGHTAFGTAGDAEPVLQAATHHTHIAVVHEACVGSDGASYIAMEYIDGPPIDEYCKAQQLAFDDRIRLLLKVFDGVTHAHRRGIIHRDLKPANILIAPTEHGPSPKIIDFGISGPRDGKSYLPGVSGTPPYWSPEQASGESSLAVTSDVYSLGVILCELLCGHLDRNTHPCRPSAALEALPRTLAQQHAHDCGATDPGNLIRTLAYELDDIVSKATARAPAERYATVDAFAQDLHRYLARRAVGARPSTPWYRLHRLYTGYRPQVLLSITIGLLAMSLILSLAVGYRNALRSSAQATAAEEVAQQEAARAQAVTDLLIDLFEDADPSHSRGRSISAMEALERGSGQVLQRLETQPATQAALLEAIARVYRHLTLYEPARDMATRAVALRETLGEGSAEHAESLRQLGLVEYWNGQYDAALVHHHQALAINERLFGQGSLAYATTLHNVGTSEMQRGQLASARPRFEQALAIKQQHLRDPHDSLAETLTALGSVYRRQGEFAMAFDAFQAAYGMRLRLGQDQHRNSLLLLSNLGATANNLGRHELAEAYLRDALAMHQALYDDQDHHHIGSVLSNLGVALSSQGKLAQARAVLGDALHRLRERVGDEHPDLAFVLHNIGSLEARRALPALAEAHFVEAVRVLEGANLREAPIYCLVHTGLAMALLDQGKVGGAAAAATAGVDCAHAVLPEGHGWIALAEVELAAVRLQQGQTARAREVLQMGLPKLIATFGDDGWRTQRARAHLSRAVAVGAP